MFYNDRDSEFLPESRFQPVFRHEIPRRTTTEHRQSWKRRVNRNHQPNGGGIRKCQNAVSESYARHQASSRLLLSRATTRQH